MGSEVRAAVASASRGMLVRMVVGDWPKSVRASKLNLPSWIPSLDLAPPAVARRRIEIRRDITRNIRIHSHETCFGRFMPFGAFRLWKPRHDILKKELMDLRDGIVEYRDEIARTVSKLAEEHSSDAWRSLNPGDVGAPPGSFVADFIRKAERFVPSRSDLHSSFRVDVAVYHHPVVVSVDRKSAWAGRPPRAVREFLSDMASDAERISWEFIEKVVSAHAAEMVRSMGALSRMLSAFGGVSRGTVRNRVSRRLEYLAAMDVSGFVPGQDALSKLRTALDSGPKDMVLSAVMIPLMDTVAKEYSRILAARAYVSEARYENDGSEGCAGQAAGDD